MHPILFTLPAWIATLIAGALLGSSLAGERSFGRRLTAGIAGALAGVGAGLMLLPGVWLPVRGYGTLILTGFLCGVWLAARRAKEIGAEPRHCVDVGVGGVILGLIGARVFHILMNWSNYTPFQSGGFEFSRIADMFKLWEGGLVFFGAFLVVLPWAWLYCRWHKIQPLVFLDLAVPGLIAGLAFGRIGCYLNGCCWGKLSDAAWAVQFPAGSPPYEWQHSAGLIHDGAPCTLAIHPAQLYASLSAALIAGFLYMLWPRRAFDGQVFSLMLLMVGVSRYFEEMLRSDDVAAFPSLSPVLTIAQWLALGLMALGVIFLAYFFFQRRRAESAKMS